MTKRAENLIPGRFFFIFLAAAGIVSGCAGKGGSPPGENPSEAGKDGVTPATIDFPTKIQPIFDRSCLCHTNPNPQGGMTLRKGASYDALVNVPSNWAPGILRVKPGAPDSSFLVMKVEPGLYSEVSPPGALMPFGSPPLASADVADLRTWILEGAKRTATPNPPPADTTPPVFAGVEAANVKGPYSIELLWSAAQDETSPPGEIAYRIYMARSSGGEDYSKPPELETAKGAIAAVVGGLRPETAYFFVVRAADGAGNADGNLREVSAVTEKEPGPPSMVDFDSQILPLFQANCVRCHGGDTGAACPGALGLCLESYAAIQRTALNGRIIKPFDSQGSELVKRIRGESLPRMPLDGPPYLAGEAIRLIEVWIDEGATRIPGGNEPPVASSAPAYMGYQGEPISFAALEAFDPDGDPIAFAWDFGDGTAAGNGRFPTHTYGQGGNYTVTLKASDGTADSEPSRASVTVLPVAGDVPKNLTVQRVCSRCHGIRITLDDGRRGQAAPPSQGFGFFPKDFTLEARARTGKAWRDKVARMGVHGATMSDLERAEIEDFLAKEYGSADGRTELFGGLCGGCHMPALALVLPRSVKMWGETVDRMVDIHGAAMTDLERWSIAGYLAEVLEGPPPVGLEPMTARIFVNRTCSTCHTPERALDAATGLPRADLRNYAGARALTGRMQSNGCGQKGVMEVIAARWLSEVTSPVPDLLYILAYEWVPATGHFLVRAWSSSRGAAILVLLAEDGRTFLLQNLGGGNYGFERENFSPPPGRIAIRSSLGSYLAWHLPIPK